MNILTTHAGRWLFALPFILFGTMHFMGAGDMATKMNVPGGEVSVYISGAGLVLGGLAIGLNRMAKIAGILLALELLLFIILIYMPWMSGDDEQMKQMAMVNILKDVALMGAALTYAGLAKE